MGQEHGAVHGTIPIAHARERHSQRCSDTFAEEAAVTGRDLLGDDRARSEAAPGRPEQVVEPVRDHDPREGRNRTRMRSRKRGTVAISPAPQGPPAGRPHRHERSARATTSGTGTSPRTRARVLRPTTRIHRQRRPHVVAPSPARLGAAAIVTATPPTTNGCEDRGLPIPRRVRSPTLRRHRDGLLRLGPTRRSHPPRATDARPSAEYSQYQPRHQRPAKRRRSTVPRDPRTENPTVATRGPRTPARARAAEFTRHADVARQRPQRTGPGSRAMPPACRQGGSVEPGHRHRPGAVDRRIPTEVLREAARKYSSSR